MQSKTSAPPRINSSQRDDLENSSLVQVLSQRLTNMEQQLFLLRDDLKNAAGTLKEKDRQIETLQNKIALAERRRELEEAGEPVDESLKDGSEVSEVASKSNSKRDKLENEVVTLAKKLEEMEKFFGDYNLAWVKEDALDEKDPNNLWIRKSNIHYTPDFEKVFLVVEELNLGNAEPQIIKKGNTAQFKNAQLLHLTLYADGIQLESNPFRKYDSPSVEEFFRDLEDGYFPTELKGSHPEGVIFKVKDKRTIKFADDPDKRPVISGSGKPVNRASSSPSSPSSISSLTEMSRKITITGESSRRSSSLKRRISSKKTLSRPSKVSEEVKPKDLTEESKEAGGSPAAPASTSAPSDNLVPSSAVGPAGKSSFPEEEKPADGAAVVDTKRELGGTADGDLRGVTDGKGESAAGKSPGGGMAAGGSPGGGVAARGSPGGGGVADLPSPGTASAADPLPPSQQEIGDGPGFKQLFRGDSPNSSTPRLRQSISAKPKDAYGLPRPPLVSRSNTATDVRPLPLGPPSKQFDNFLFPKTTETQTSVTLMPGITPTAAPQAAPPQNPQPTHVTNITYNEAPITVQMTPSELLGKKSTGTGVPVPSSTQEGAICPTHHHHPHPCNCVRIPCETSSSSGQPDGGLLGSVPLAKFPGETEYRQKFTESAINNINVLGFKKKLQQSRSPSPHPVPRQPAATLLVGPDDAPIPPDPLPPLNIDPNDKWEHFTFLGHPKGQPPAETLPIRKGPTPKIKSSPQVVQLNEKTSDRMIAVRMRTKSGSKECVAHVYPDEPVNKLWSLLKLNPNDHSMASSATPHEPLKSGSVGDLSKGDDLTLIISKNKGGADVPVSPRKSGSRGPSEKRISDEKSLVESRKEVSSVSKDGSLVTNVNIDSHSSLGGRSKSSSVRPNTDKKETKSKKSSQESVGSLKTSKSLLAKDSKNSIVESRPSGDSRHSKSSEGAQVTNVNIDSQSSLGGRSKSSSVRPNTDKKETKSKKPSQESVGSLKTSKSLLAKDSKNSIVESRPPGHSRHSTVNSEGSKNSVKEPVEGAAPKNVRSYQSEFPPEITPKSRANSLSKHLSSSSLHKTSFKESLRKLEVINEVEPSQSSGMHGELMSSATMKRPGQIDEGDVQPAMKSPVKKGSNNSADGLSSFVLPTTSTQHGAGAEPLPSAPLQVPEKSLSLDALAQPSLRDATNRPSPHDLQKQPSLRDVAKQPSLQSAAEQPLMQDALVDIVEYPHREKDRASDDSKSRIPDSGPQEPTVAAAAPANGDVVRAQEDAPSADSRLQDSKPFPRPPDDSSNRTVVHARRSGDIETFPGLPTTSSPAVKETRQDLGEDIHSEMKSLVNSATLGIATGTSLAEITAKNSDPPKPDATVTEPKRKRSSSDGNPKKAVDRENWHPVEEPPAIGKSDLDMGREDQPTAIAPRTSYSTTDSEQIFGRYQHPEAKKDDGLRTEDAPKDNSGAKEKSDEKNHKKKKGKSDKKSSIEEAKSAELDGGEAVESIKSLSAASVQSEADQEEAAAANELKGESVTAV